ncbi:MAG TPA: condensation domain-containing protein, partial [Blastocatellia bacterium]|nr:condensation domain-containing protein [Blastocatellia bacterium]
LARSYFNDAELTAEKFTPDPFGDEPGARLYKTGDLGRYLADGNISYLGRADQQVKIRGFRVEPGEVEVVLRQHPDVLDAAVVPQEDSKGNNKLVAYVVWDTREQVGEVRNFLKSKLPEYMLPAVFVPLASLPMNANGKLDRQALPIVEGLGSQSGENYVAPRNAVEEILAGLWSEVLAVTGVGVNDSFFESGGHSLLATQLVSRVREAFQIDLPLRRLFESPTIASMAGHINAALGAGEIFKAPPIERAPRDKALALSFAQQRLWFFDRLQPGSPLYNVPSALLVKGDLNVTALRQSLNEIVKRHEALRTTFAANGGEPVQTIAQDVYVPLPVVDLTSLREGERDSEAKRLTLEEGQQPFDISRGPLMRAKLLRTNDDTHVLLLTVHHIVFDGWSGRVFVTELGELYNSLSAGEAASLPALGIQYSDFAHWQREWMRGEVLASQLSYWTEQLESLSRLDVPTDFPGREAESFKGARQTFLVAKELAGSLNELSRRKGVTLFMLLLAAFDALLHRYSRQEDIVVGTPIANRNRTEIEGLIGMFVNTLAIRVNLGGNPTFNELLGRVREAALGAYAHQDLPFEKLVEELHLERDARRNPVFQVMFVLHNTPMPPLQLTGLTLSPLDVETGTAKFSLTLSMMESEEGLIGSLEYNTDLFKASTIEHMVCGFETLLESIVSGPDRRVDSLPMLTESESRQLLVEWNQTGREYPREQCINQIFEQQVEHAPDAIAVMFADQRLTYREINERANQLSHHLLSLGAGPESLVAIYLERSVEMIVALLATAKAGAAYVPLDTTYPLERIAFVLEEIQAAIILTQDSLVYELPACWAQIICLDSDRDQVAAQSVENPVNNAAPDNLAYVIYTSGSTGQPKGVCVTHRNVA